MKLLGLAEIAELLDVTKQVVANWRTRKPDFPPPVANLKSGSVWDEEAIITWAVSQDIPIALRDSHNDKEGGNEIKKEAIVAAMMNMKGGVGKSTLTANLGWYAALIRDLRVLLIDLDPQFNLSQYILGVAGYEKLLKHDSPTIEAVLRPPGKDCVHVDLRSTIHRVKQWNDGSCLHLIPANLELAWSMKVAIERAHILKDEIAEIKNEYDLIIIDCSPTESILTTASYMASDYIFVPVRPEFLSTIGLPLLMKSLEQFKVNYKTEDAPEIGGIIFNDTSEKVEHDRSRNHVKAVALEYNIEVFENEVSHSDSYPAGARAGKPIFLTENARDWKKHELNRVASEFLKRIGL